MPSALAGLAVIQRIAWASVIVSPAARPAASASAASWFSRWIRSASSDLMIAQPPAASTRGTLASTESYISSFSPHQLVQVATQMSFLASRSAIL